MPPCDANHWDLATVASSLILCRKGVPTLSLNTIPTPAPRSPLQNDRQLKRKLLSLFGNIIGNTIIVCLGIFTIIAITSCATIKDTKSMEPTFTSQDLIWPYLPYLYVPQLQRGDIVALDIPTEPDYKLKRLIGLPGEEIELDKGYLFINGQPVKESYLTGPIYMISDGPVTLGPDQFYVLGDNRLNSMDSTEYGPIPANR